MATPANYFNTVPQHTTTTSSQTGYVWSIRNTSFSDGAESRSDYTWFNSTSGAPTNAQLNIPSQPRFSNIYKVTTTTVISNTQNMVEVTFNYTNSAPVITGSNITSTTNGVVTTYTDSSSGTVTRVLLGAVGVAYGSNTGNSNLISAFNSNTQFDTTITTSHNALLTGGWANATGTFSAVVADESGRLYFTPEESSDSVRYITKNGIATITPVFTDNNRNESSTICTVESAITDCNPLPPSETTTVTSAGSSSTTASIGGWLDSSSSTSSSDSQAEVDQLIRKFKGSSMAYGASSNATGANNIAYGHGSQAHGYHSNNISFGTSAESDGTNGVAFGAGSRSDGANALAFGASSLADGQRVISIGSGSTSDGTDAVALGSGSAASGDRVLSLGSDSKAAGTDALAMGAGSTANGQQALAIGDNSEANGIGVIAIGSGAKALGYNTNGLAIGTQSTAIGTDVTALGAGASATGIRATAVGAGAQASHTGSTAIGAGASTTAADQVVLGTSSTSLVVPGLGASGRFAGRSKQQGQTRVVTTDASGNVGTAFNPKLMEQSISDIARATQTSAAIAAAFSAVPSMTQLNGEPARCGFGTGGFGSQYAVAGGCALKISESFFLNGAVSYAPSIDYNFGSTPAVAGRLGFSFPLGRIAKSKTTTEAINQDVLQTIESQQQEISELRAINQEVLKTLKSQQQQISELRALVELRGSTPGSPQ
jgi:hypothetical protein